MSVTVGYDLESKSTLTSALGCTQVIEPEYTAKYLEHLGASPSQAAQDLVRKALPLTASCLQTKLKVSSTRGCVAQQGQSLIVKTASQPVNLTG